MAPESILERVYTSASDVWSFGVLCWEVYSLGEAPYPRKTAEEVLIALAKGYRMERPPLCPENMYVFPPLLLHQQHIVTDMSSSDVAGR
jgi:proto-oncogene tyrosine-protein kinase Ret